MVIADRGRIVLGKCILTFTHTRTLVDACSYSHQPFKTGPFCHLIMVTQRARGARTSGKVYLLHLLVVNVVL